MKNTQHVSMIAAVLVCLIAAQGNATLFASDEAHTATDAAVLSPSSTNAPPQTQTLTTLNLDAAIAASHLNFAPSGSNALGGQVYRGRPYSMHRNGSIAALMVGAAATITGAALLVYANRPDCSTNQFASACGYGTKVIGTSVLVGGAAGLFIGALTWK